MEDQQKINPNDVAEFIQAGSLGFRLDWESYFKEFCHRNGDNPVMINVNGTPRFLFRTGWMYGNKYEGPEYPPVDDPKKVKSLLHLYWRIRMRTLVEIRDQLSETVSSLETLQKGRSLPLQVKEIMWDDIQHKPVTRGGDIHMDRLQDRLTNLDRLIAECNHHLTTTTTTNKEGSDYNE